MKHLKTRILLLCCAGLACLGGVAFADTEASNDFGMWTPVTLQFPLPDLESGEPNPVKFSLMAMPRFNNSLRELDELLLWPSVEYRLNEHVSLEGGYVWRGDFGNKRTGHNFKVENRLWQGVVLKKSFDRVTLVSRTRLEERFQPGVDSLPVRTRQLFGVRYALGDEKKWYLSASNELFWNLSTHHGAQQGGFGEDRVYAGVGRHINERMRAETGYQMQYVNRTGGPGDLINHQLMVQLLYSFH